MADKLKVSITATEATKLIRKLGTDDAFRKKLETNPAETLAQLNVSLPDSFFGPGFKVPPKEVFQKMTSELKIGAQGVKAAEVVFLAFFAFFKK